MKSGLMMEVRGFEVIRRSTKSLSGTSGAAASTLQSSSKKE